MLCLQFSRNDIFVLGEVERLLKKEAGDGNTVLASFAGKTRWVKVNGELAFQQDKDNPNGVFSAPFSHLAVPR